MSRDPEQFRTPMVSSAPPSGTTIVARERDPRTARLMRSGRISEDGRHQKERRRRKVRRSWAAAPIAIVIASALAIGAVAVGAFLLLGDDSDDSDRTVADLAADYSVRATVVNTRGNTNFTVGQQTTFPITLECTGSPCRLRSDEWLAVRVSGDSLSGNWTRNVPCPSNSAIPSHNTYDLDLHATTFATIDGHRVPTEFRGDETVGAIEGECPDIEVRPVTYRVVMKRTA